MTTGNDTSAIASTSKGFYTPQLHLLFMACVPGAVVGVLFMIVQPLFGMDTLTSRHAAAYQQLDAKFVLHLGFFAVISAVLYVYKNRQQPSVAVGELRDANSQGSAGLERPLLQ